MRIRMKYNKRGSEDGFVVRVFHKDCIYTVSENITRTLASHLLNCGAAEVVEDRRAA